MTKPAPSQRRLVAAKAGIVVGLLAAGAAAGWSLRGITTDNEEPQQSVAVVIDRPVVDAAKAADVNSTTPNVIGLDEPQAIQVFLDAGYPLDAVRTQAVAAGGESDIVVAQEPSPGSPPDGLITLFVSQQTTTPDLAGLTLDQARTRLNELGVRSLLDRIYDPLIPEGQVVASTPSPGEPLPAEVTLTISEAPSGVYLNDLRPIEDSDCRSRPTALGANDYDAGITCSMSRDTQILIHSLNGEIARFRADVGLTLDADTDIPVTLQVIGDGQVLDERFITTNEPTTIDVSLLGVAQLELRMTRPETEERVSWSFAFGNPTLLGSSAAIDALVTATGR